MEDVKETRNKKPTKKFCQIFKVICYSAKCTHKEGKKCPEIEKGKVFDPIAAMSGI